MATKTDDRDGMIMIAYGQDWLCQDGEIRLYSTVTEKLSFDEIRFFRALVSRFVPDMHFNLNP